MIRTLAACLLVLAATFSASSQSCTYNAGFHLVEGRDSTPQPTMARPTAGAWYKDPVYGTCVVRATDFRAEGFSDFARNDYSRRQAFNADNSMYLIYGNRGAWQVYSIATLQRIKELPYLGGDAEPQWHPTNPDLLYFLPTNGGMVIYELTVSTGTRRTVADFTGRLPWPTAVHVWTKSEGSPSADARYWGLMVDDDSWASLGFFTYDMQRDSIVATYATNGRRPDNVSMSPTDQYLVVNWDELRFRHWKGFP